MNNKKLTKALRKELKAVEKQEQRMERAALKAKDSALKEKLQSKIPQKISNGLEAAFCKGFGTVFGKGTAVVEKLYNKESVQADHKIRSYAVQLKGGRKELKQVRKAADAASNLNFAVTAAEGVALGLLGIGLPDIVVFLGMLLKGIYRTALDYGFDYDSNTERYLILKMMQTSLLKGEEWSQSNAEVDEMISGAFTVTEEEYKAQMSATSSAFAMDMLLLKTIQGIPIVGIIGGVSDPIYYSKVLKYVKLKYRKRYLMNIE